MKLRGNWPAAIAHRIGMSGMVDFTSTVVGQTLHIPCARGHKVDCGNCYGNGCGSCSNRGWVETEEGRESREDAEDRRADEARERRMLGDD